MVFCVLLRHVLEHRSIVLRILDLGCDWGVKLAVSGITVPEHLSFAV